MQYVAGLLPLYAIPEGADNVQTVTLNGHEAIAPQSGPQEDFCRCSADIAIYGGQAFGGKSVAELLEGQRHADDGTYRGVIFRRNYNAIIEGGGLWDTSEQIYVHTGGVGVRGKTEWVWPSGARLKFNHLAEESTIYEHQGSAYVFLGFDELTHFTKKQFFYLLTRNRPPSGCYLKPYCRATCNAEPGWVADLIAWWWDPETGYPIPERSGVVRYFTVEDTEIIWVSKDYRDINGMPPKSFTFIMSTIDDNPFGNVADPHYRSNLQAQDRVTRERLLKGNWLIAEGGNMFDPTWFGVVDDYPRDMRIVRYWDFAASEVKEKDKNDPDWTAGAKCGVKNGVFYIIDVPAFREAPGKTEQLIRNIAEQDGTAIEVWWEEEKGSSGKYASAYMQKIFSGYECHPDPVAGSKVERAKPWSAWAEHGKVKLVRGEWNRKFLQWASKFPDGKRDMIDSVSGCFKVLVSEKKVFQYYKPWNKDQGGHILRFQKEREDFDRVTTGNIEVYATLWALETGEVSGCCWIWSTINKRLRLYNDFVLMNPMAGDIVSAVREALVVPMVAINGGHGMLKAIGNEHFFNLGGESLQKEVKKAGLRVRMQEAFDIPAAVLQINKLFSEDRITIHSECQESDIQWRGWAYDEKKIRDGYPLARSLCLIVHELTHEGKTLDRRPMPPYSKQKQGIRDRLKSMDVKPEPVKYDKQYEYLTI